MVGLRNAIAHPHHRNTSQVDYLMQNAQSLACSLGDESRAMQIRHLRDEVQRKRKSATRTS